MPKPEAILLAQIKSFLQYKIIYFHRINTGLIQTERKTFYRSAERGTPDILLCHKGKFIAIEAKSKTGRQSEWQKADETRLKESGGIYWIIRDVYELKVLIENINQGQ